LRVETCKFTWEWKTIFVPVKKAHPALRCSNYSHLLARLTENGVTVVEASGIPGVRRSHIRDPFGNRIELIAD
jgi:hypothetical protein